MNDSDFSSSSSIKIYIYLDWHRACVLATMRCRTRSMRTNDIHGLEEKENDGAVRCSSCGTNLISFLSRSIFLLSLLMLMPSLSLSLPLLQTYHQAMAPAPMLTYREKEKSVYIHIQTRRSTMTQRLGHASIHIKQLVMLFDAKKIRHRETLTQPIVMIDNSIRLISQQRQSTEKKWNKKKHM